MGKGHRCGLSYCSTCQGLSIAFSLLGRAPCSLLPGPTARSPGSVSSSPPVASCWPAALAATSQSLGAASLPQPLSTPHPPVIRYVDIWGEGNCNRWKGTLPSQCPQLWVFPLGLLKLTPPEPSSKVFLAPGADPHPFLASWLLGWEWDRFIALANFCDVNTPTMADFQLPV